jgi:hypothetical protein
MGSLLVKCALLAAAIAAVAAMAGLEMHAIIILIVVGLCILVLVIGGPPDDPIDQTLAPWWAGNSGDAGHPGSGPLLRKHRWWFRWRRWLRRRRQWLNEQLFSAHSVPLTDQLPS